jgi:hypothetical protein
MKNNVTLSIPNPCSEKWESFSMTSNGAFCDTCSKKVVDFTKMGDSEILEYLKNKSTKTCGRFRSDQMKSYAYQTPLQINTGLVLLKAGLISLLLMILSKQTFAQNTNTMTKTEAVQKQGQPASESTTITSDQKIKGVVISDEDQSPLPGVNIYLKGSSDGTSANANGEFDFPKKLKEGDTLVFSFIGFDTKEYIIPKEVPAKIEIHMSAAYIEMMGAVAVDEVYESKQTGIGKLWIKVKSIF